MIASEPDLKQPAADPGFGPLEPRVPGQPRNGRLSEQVGAAIRQAIQSGRFNPGDRLPNETALAGQFGVSRVAVREAIKSLEGQGFVQVRRGAGGGVFVRRVSPRAVTEALYSLLRVEGFEVGHLHEARLLIEPSIAALAAQRLTPMTLAELERDVARDRAGMETGQPMITSMELHSKLARLSGNPILELLMGLLSDLLETSRLLHASPIDTSKEAGEQVIRDHEAIVAALAARDSERVRGLMVQHLGRISSIESSAL